MDIKELREEISSSVTDRLRNPFVLTFVISWFSWNWLLIYELVNFSDHDSIGNRIGIINAYIQNHLWDNLTIVPLFGSLIVSLIYLIFSSAFLALFNFYNTTIKAKIFYITAKGENIPRKLYDLLNKKHNKLKKDFDEARILWNEMEDRNNQLNDELIESKNEILSQEIQINEITNEAEKVEAELKALKEVYEQMQFFNAGYLAGFSTNFVNKKAWLVLTTNFSGLFDITETIRFEEKGFVTDTKSGEVKYEIRDLKYSIDGRMLSFNLSLINDLKQIRSHYLMNIGFGVYKGFVIESDAVSPKEIIFTQNLKDLENFQKQIRYIKSR